MGSLFSFLVRDDLAVESAAFQKIILIQNKFLFSSLKMRLKIAFLAGVMLHRPHFFSRSKSRFVLISLYKILISNLLVNNFNVTAFIFYEK